MNREIKFRVWDKLNKILIKSYYCSYFLAIDGGLYFIDKDHPLALEDNEFIIMQYTGLEDSTGKEIYEGDIVNTKYEGDILGSKKEIKFRYGMFCVETDFDYSGVISLYHFNLDATVLGNIYENPYLLEPK